MKPTAVVFDLGKVLVDFDYNIAAERIGARCSNGKLDLRPLMATSESLLIQYETGLLTTDQFCGQVMNLAGFAGSIDEFGPLFADIFAPIEPMIELNERVRAAGTPTYIFSNTNPLAVDHIRERFPFFRNFDRYILSYEHRAMKPDPRIYEVVENVTGRRGAEILYIDDRPENIDAGINRGWHTILQHDPMQTRSRFVELGLL